MDRFWRIPEAEVLRLQRKAEQAEAMWKAHQEVIDRLLPKIGESGWEAVWTAVNDSQGWAQWIGTGPDDPDAERKPLEPLPVGAYIAPVKRWAGGPPEMDAWYWDYNAF